jgi:acetylglutamate kinase
MVLAGKTNKDLVNLISLKGGRALGLSGLDCGLIKAKKLEGDYGYVGDIIDINIQPVLDLLDKKYIPVISTIAQGIDNSLEIDANGIGGERNSVYNINADTAAAEIAIKLKAEKLILLTDIKGLLTDIKYEETLVPVVKLNEIEDLKTRGIISGGMIPKIDCCESAIKGGVNRAHIIDGRIQHSLLIEMLSDEGIGTMFEK